MLRRVLVVLGMLIAMAAPASAGGGGCHGPATEGSGTTVDIIGFCFDATVLHAEVGDTITWHNGDSAPHNVVSTAFDTTGLPLSFGHTYEATFDTAGVYPYVCSIHPGMVGAVVVGDAESPPPPPAAATAVTTAEFAESLGVAAKAGLTDEIEGRLAAVEASLVAMLAPAGPSAWPPLAVGLLAGVALAVVASRLRLLS